MALTVQSIRGDFADRREQRDGFERAASRLASGRRIVEALDDPAGLAIADGLLRDYAVSAQAVRNASDGLSALHVAEGGLAQIEALNGRLAELATQAASGLLDDAQRAALGAEFTALGSEVDRIAATTAFNGQPLLQGGAAVALQVGIDGSANAQVSIVPPDASTAALGLAGASLATVDGARAALDAVAGAEALVASARSRVAATEARLTSTVTTLRQGAEGAAAAASRIADADFATEAALLVRGRVQQYARTAVQAQANLSAGVILDLLA